MYIVHYMYIMCTLHVHHSHYLLQCVCVIDRAVYNHYYYIIGKWSNPTVTGHSPPCCHGFSFVKINNNKVILFGGRIGKDQNGPLSNQLYLLSLNNLVSNCCYNHTTPTILLLGSPENISLSLRI